MARKKRDPRITPQPGDVFMKGPSRCRILECGPGGFAYDFTGSVRNMPPMPDWTDDRWMAKFRKWAASAEVE